MSIISSYGKLSGLLIVPVLTLWSVLLLAGSPMDNSDYATVLSRYVDAEGLVNYAALKANREPLDRYVKQLDQLSPSEYQSWSSQEQIALWVNAYNALTLKAIIDHYPIRSSFFTSLVYPKKSIRQIDGVWDELQFSVMGEKRTLDEIEHQILRVEFQEPRIHMALVCAALSCPPLRAQPFEGARLDEQFQEQSRQFLSRPDNFRIEASGKQQKVYLSSIFEWFGGDFVPVYGNGSRFAGQNSTVRAVLNFVSDFIPADQVSRLEGNPLKVDYTSYDWTLNEQQ